MFLGHLVRLLCSCAWRGLYRQQEVGIKKSSSKVAVLVGFFGWMGFLGGWVL